MSNSANEHQCPRRSEDGVSGDHPFTFVPKHDSWVDERTCSYCGSLNPDYLMQRLEAGDVKLTPTDKSYKVYVLSLTQEPVGSPTGKFYFQHLSEEQKQRFVDLLNGKKLTLNVPGYFYTLPYFMTRKEMPA